jgi:CheY-like chemotaxis protein
MNAQKHILLIEDDTTLVFTLSDRLVSEGYGVEAVSDGAQGLKAALSGRFDGMLPHFLCQPGSTRLQYRAVRLKKLLDGRLAAIIVRLRIRLEVLRQFQ